MFRYWLQGGRIDVGFLAAAQIDRFANINTTVVGDYAHPKVRLPGAGGAPEIAASAKEVFIMLRKSSRAFVDSSISSPPSAMPKAAAAAIAMPSRDADRRG